MDKYFLLFSCCVPVKGECRSTICDLQRDAYILVPNDIYEIITRQARKKRIDEIAAEIGDPEILKWFDRLVNEEYGFYAHSKEEVDSFPVLAFSYAEPKPITNAIIDFDQSTFHDMEKIFAQLSEHLCESVEIRFFYEEQLSNIKKILLLAEGASFRSIEVITGYNKSDYDRDALISLLREIPVLTKITVHSYIENVLEEVEMGRKLLIGTKKEIDSEHHCGVVSEAHFVSNLKVFTEAKHRNSCLSNKIAIDKNGDIKNCPSLQKSFGNISDTSLSDVIATAQFQELGQIKKDEISKCKVCEFRYMCQDCRAYITDPTDLYSKPEKCSYDPYQAIWK